MTDSGWLDLLPVRVQNVLANAGLDTPEAVLATPDEVFLRLRNAGRPVLRMLRELGLRPDSCPVPWYPWPAGHACAHGGPPPTCERSPAACTEEQGWLYAPGYWCWYGPHAGETGCSPCRLFGTQVCASATPAVRHDVGDNCYLPPRPRWERS